MDEAGLFCRSPSRGLSTQPQRVKKDKSRITVVVCTNCTGSDRLPLWIIGQSQQPRALRGINIIAPEQFIEKIRSCGLQALL